MFLIYSNPAQADTAQTAASSLFNICKHPTSAAQKGSCRHWQKRYNNLAQLQQPIFYGKVEKRWHSTYWIIQLMFFSMYFIVIDPQISSQIPAVDFFCGHSTVAQQGLFREEPKCFNNEVSKFNWKDHFSVERAL